MSLKQVYPGTGEGKPFGKFILEIHISDNTICSIWGSVRSGRGTEVMGNHLEKRAEFGQGALKHPWKMGIVKR